MPHIHLNDIDMYYTSHGTPDGPPVVFAHALGVDHRIWERVIPLLPQSAHFICYDLRGHGQTSTAQPPYSMGTLVRDAESLMEALDLKQAMFVGLSIGGLIAQGLAVKRYDLIRSLVLSNTAAKIGIPPLWAARQETAKTKGMAHIIDETLLRWFGPKGATLDDAQSLRTIMEGQNTQGYVGCCAAISGTDFYTPTSGLRLPTLGLAGSEDRSTPPDLVRETLDLIPGSKFELIRKSGHIPAWDAPETFAQHLTQFMKETGHV